MTCPCKSGRPHERCHLPMATEAYKPRATRDLIYKLPSHVTRNQSEFYAGRISIETSYRIDSSVPSQWTLQPPDVSVPFVLVPLLRGRVQDPELVVIRDAFRRITHWPTEPPLTPEQRDRAQYDLVSAAVTRSANDLHAVRESFVKLLHFGDALSLEAGLRDLVLTLRTAFPQATLDVLQLDPRTLSEPLLIRILALMPLMEIRELTGILERPVADPYVHSLFTPEPFFELLANLSFPRTFGFGVRFGPHAYICVDYGQDITLDPLEWTERRARDVGAAILASTTDTLRTRAFPAMRPEDRHFLRTWLARRLNFLYGHLCDLSSILPSHDGSIQTTTAWKDLLTIKDIVALTQLIATSSDPTVIRLVFFDLIDRLGELGGHPTRKADEILSEPFITGIADALDEGLLDLRPVVREYLLESWQRFADGIWENVLNEDARASRVINVSAPGEPPTLFSGSDFVSRFARVLRNTTHGYHLKHRAFENYRVRHSGLLPDSVRELAIALWFCLLACPEKFWPDPDRFTRMEKVSLPGK